IARESRHNDWILTSSAITAQTPAAANLLGWELLDLYEREPVALGNISLIDIYHEGESRWIDWKDPNKSQDYARLEFADRVTEQDRISRCLVHNPGFIGQQVLFINDIRITGAQQRAMQKYFEDVKATSVKWLYLIVTDPEIGRAEPKIE